MTLNDLTSTLSGSNSQANRQSEVGESDMLSTYGLEGPYFAKCEKTGRLAAQEAQRERERSLEKTSRLSQALTESQTNGRLADFRAQRERVRHRQGTKSISLQMEVLTVKEKHTNTTELLTRRLYRDTKRVTILLQDLDEFLQQVQSKFQSEGQPESF